VPCNGNCEQGGRIAGSGTTRRPPVPTYTEREHYLGSHRRRTWPYAS